MWDNLDEKSLQHIKEYIIENNFIGRELDGVPGRYDEDDPYGDGLREDMLLDNDLLGELIENESMFGNLALELKNLYRWAYESAAESELHGDMMKEVISVIGSKPDYKDDKKTLTTTDKNNKPINADLNLTPLIIEDIRSEE